MEAPPRRARLPGAPVAGRPVAAQWSSSAKPVAVEVHDHEHTARKLHAFFTPGNASQPTATTAANRWFAAVSWVLVGDDAQVEGDRQQADRYAFAAIGRS